LSGLKFVILSVNSSVQFRVNSCLYPIGLNTAFYGSVVCYYMTVLQHEFLWPCSLSGIMK